MSRVRIYGCRSGSDPIHASVDPDYSWDELVGFGAFIHETEGPEAVSELIRVEDEIYLDLPTFPITLNSMRHKALIDHHIFRDDVIASHIICCSIAMMGAPYKDYCEACIWYLIHPISEELYNL